MQVKMIIYIFFIILGTGSALLNLWIFSLDGNVTDLIFVGIGAILAFAGVREIRNLRAQEKAKNDAPTDEASGEG